MPAESATVEVNNLLRRCAKVSYYNAVQTRRKFCYQLCARSAHTG